MGKIVGGKHKLCRGKSNNYNANISISSNAYEAYQQVGYSHRANYLNKS